MLFLVKPKERLIRGGEREEEGRRSILSCSLGQTVERASRGLWHWCWWTAEQKVTMSAEGLRDGDSGITSRCLLPCVASGRLAGRHCGRRKRLYFREKEGEGGKFCCVGKLGSVTTWTARTIVHKRWDVSICCFHTSWLVLQNNSKLNSHSSASTRADNYNLITSASFCMDSVFFLCLHQTTLLHSCVYLLWRGTVPDYVWVAKRSHNSLESPPPMKRTANKLLQSPQDHFKFAVCNCSSQQVYSLCTSAIQLEFQ